MTKLARRALKWFLYGFSVLVLLLTTLLILAFSSAPLVPASSSSMAKQDSSQTELKPLLARLKRQLQYQDQITQIEVKQKEIDDVIVFGMRAFEDVSATANVTESGAYAAASIRFNRIPLLPYLNISGLVLPSKQGLDLAFIRIGDIQLRGTWVLSTMRFFAKMMIEDDNTVPLIDAVQSVDITNQSLYVTMIPLADIKQRAQTILASFGQLNGEQSKPEFWPQIPVYIDLIQQQQQRLGLVPQVSLAEYLTPLFAHANQNDHDLSSQMNNTALLWAVVIQLGNPRFGQLIGFQRNDSQASLPPPRNVVLAGRRDLALHFVYSIGLELLARRRISTAIGEFKELTDAESGGSGFSFVDLAADKAGAKFAEFLTRVPADAYTARTRLSIDASEPVFFPPALDLPEGLTQAEFSQQFEHVESQAYKAMEKEIDQRIKRLPLYQP